jgi:hypothetical protein
MRSGLRARSATSPLSRPRPAPDRLQLGRLEGRAGRQRGSTSVEMLVIAGILVAGLLVMMVAFRQELTGAMDKLALRIRCSVSGASAGCGGGAAQQQAASGNPASAVRGGGLASGLVMSGQNGAAGSTGSSTTAGLSANSGFGGVGSVTSGPLAGMFGSAAGGLGSALGSAGAAVSGAAGSAGSALAGAGTAVRGAAESAGSALTGAGAAVRGAAESAGSALTGAGAAVRGAAGSTATGAAGSGGGAAAGVAGGAASSLASAGAAGGTTAAAGVGTAGGAGTPDAMALQTYRNQLTQLTNRINGFQQPDLNWQEQGARLWNATSLFQSNRDLVTRQDELNDMANTAHIKAQTWAQVAGQRLEAGDASGFQQAMNNARRYNQMSNGMQGRSASIMADAADQAMGEAANVRQISFATASAIANPVGFVAGQTTGFVVSTVADQVLPDGRVKQVVVGVSSAAAAAYAGGMTPDAWQHMGAAATAFGQSAGYAVGIADQVTSVTTTYNTMGATDAGWEVATALITHGVMNTRIQSLGNGPDGQARSLSQYLSQAPSAAAIKETLENNAVPLGQFEVTAQNIRSAYEVARGNKPEDPITYRPLDADQAYVKTFGELKDPDPLDPKVQEAIKAGERLGQTPEMVIDKLKHAQVTGGTFFDRGTQLEATQLIQDGEAVGKGTPQHQKSAGEVSHYLPMDSMEAKPGQALRAAEQALANATTPQETLKANQDITKAWQAIADNETAIHESLAAGTVAAGPSPDPRIHGRVAYDPETGLPFVGDVDPVTNNLSRPSDPIRNGGERGLGTYRELQDVANLRDSLSGDNLTTTANHGAGSRNPGKEPLPNLVIMYTPDGRAQVIEGQVNVLNAIRASGSGEHPSWAAQAQEAMAANPGGPQLIPPPANPPTPLNQEPTAGQAALANNRNTLRNQFVDTVQQNANWKDDEVWFYNIDGSGVPQTLRMDRNRRVPGIALVARHGDVLADRRPVFVVPGRPSAEAAAVTAARQARAATATAPDVARDRTENHAFKNGLNSVIEQYKTTWDDRQTLAHMKAYGQMRGYVLAELGEKDRVDAFVRWAFGVDTRTEPLPLPTANQSALAERIDAQAQPAWRADLDAHRAGGLHSGLVQHYTRQALAVGQQKVYPAYPAQEAMAKTLLTLTGEDCVRAAFFTGGVAALYTRIGTMLGASDAASARAAGFAFVQHLDRAALAADTARAQELFTSLARGRALPRPLSS